MRVLPRENEDVNECWISDRDRFSYEALNSSERLTKPLIRVDGALREVEWNVALDYMCHALRDIATTHTADAIAALAAPNSTLEELYLLNKLMAGLGSGNVDFRPRRRDFSADTKLHGTPWLGMRLTDIATLDAVLVVGSFLRKDHPLFAQRLRQLAKKSGKVSLLSVTADDQLINLHAQLAVRPSELASALGRVVKAVAELKGLAVPGGLESLVPCEDSVSIAQSLVNGKKSAVFLGNVAEQHPQAGQIHFLACKLSEMIGGHLGFIGESANSVGGYVAKCLPGSGLNAYEMFAQPRKAYLLLGLEPELDCQNPSLARNALKQASLVVMISPFKHEAALDYADVLLPSAPYTETSGTFVNTEGRVQSFAGVVRPLGDARPAWKILRVVANLLGLTGFDYESSDQIRDEAIRRDCDFVDGLDNGVDEVPLTLVDFAPKTGIERVGQVPIYSTDILVRRAASLQMTSDAAAPAVRLSAQTMDALGVFDGSLVRVKQDGGDSVLKAVLDLAVPDGCARVVAGCDATAPLGDMFGLISVERA